MEFGELVEHLNDLIELAEQEGFPRFAAELVAARDKVTQSPPVDVAGVTPAAGQELRG